MEDAERLSRITTSTDCLSLLSSTAFTSPMDTPRYFSGVSPVFSPSAFRNRMVIVGPNSFIRLYTRYPATIAATAGTIHTTGNFHLACPTLARGSSPPEAGLGCDSLITPLWLRPNQL